MNNQFIERLKDIEMRLETITRPALDRQPKKNKDLFVDDESFQHIMGITSKTAFDWREFGIIKYFFILGKIYYKIVDINAMLDEHYRLLKKK